MFKSRILSVLRVLGLLLACLVALSADVSRADFTKTINVQSGIQVNAVTTWYYSSCTQVIAVGSYAVDVAPQHGSLSFGDVSGPIPGCPAGSPSLPAAAAYYTWTDTTSNATTDYFQLTFSVDGASEVIDVSVVLQPLPCAMTFQTLATVPGIDSTTRTQIGVGESVQLATVNPVTFTIASNTGNAVLSQTVQPTTESDFPGAIGYPVGFPSDQCVPDQSGGSVTGSQACFIAPYANDTVTVTAIGGGSTCTAAFTVLQPTGLVLQRLTYPPTSTGPSPDYYFERLALDYNIGMTPAVFLTPGTVSFVNIRISEHDAVPPHFSPNYASLFTVNGSNVWLVGCDKDYDNTGGADTDPKSFPWVFADRQDLTETKFSIVQTAWTGSIQGLLHGYQYEKGQVQALGNDGTFIDTPLTPQTAAILTLPAHAQDFNDWVIGTPLTCPVQVMAQFTQVENASKR